jgi:hypothetical protein
MVAVPDVPTVFNVPGLHLIQDEQALLSNAIDVRVDPLMCHSGNTV